MQDKDHWNELCEQAAVEQTSTTLYALVKEINRLLQEKEERLRQSRSKT